MSAAQHPLIVIAGPTGSGKSRMAIEIALRVGGEIVNCDSLQIYKGFDVGTAKTPHADRAGIPHHLFDVSEPHKGYSAGEYARQAREALRGIAARGRVPVVVGGTGFYLHALLHGLPPLPERDEALRAHLLRRETRRPGSLHRLLTRLEPAAARRIHARDRQKTIRALEIRLLTKKALPRLWDSTLPLAGYRTIKIGLNPDRTVLNARLDPRAESMFRGGLLEEVRGLLASGATGAEKPFESLGYKQALRNLKGEMTLEEAIASTQLETRQYAKRQATWFRRDPEIFWIQDFGDAPGALELALAHIRK